MSVNPSVKFCKSVEVLMSCRLFQSTKQNSGLFWSCFEMPLNRVTTQYAFLLFTSEFWPRYEPLRCANPTF